MSMWKTMLIAALFAMMNIAFAQVSVNTELHCNGSCSVNITHNENNFSISSNSSLDLVSNSSDNSTEIEANATGLGNASVNGNEDYLISAEADDNVKKVEGTGFFQEIFNFFRQIKIFAWFGN